MNFYNPATSAILKSGSNFRKKRSKEQNINQNLIALRRCTISILPMPDTSMQKNIVEISYTPSKFQDMGKMEVITCGATHGYLPLMNNNVNAMRAQINVAVQHYEKHFGRKPRGIWLPECAYEPGVEQLLKDAGIRFFITETHGILFASPRPKYGIYAPIYCPTGIAAFGRDMESSRQVWSSKEGYPGDFFYRDFYAT